MPRSGTTPDVRFKLQRASEARRKAWAEYTAGWTGFQKAEVALLPLAVFAVLGVAGLAIQLLLTGHLLEGGVIFAPVFVSLGWLIRRMVRFPAR